MPAPLPTSQTISTSNWETYILLVKGNIGAGCLALPYCFSMFGKWYSVLTLMAVGYLCVYNMYVLIKCKRYCTGVKTYGGIGLVALGRIGESVIEFFLSVMQLSICCVYVSFIGSSLSPLLFLDYQVITLLLIIPIVLITKLRQMRQIAKLAALAFTLLLIALLIIAMISIIRISTGNVVPQAEGDSGKFVIFIVSAIYAFEGIGIVLPIENAMAKPSDFGSVLSLSMLTVGIVFVTFALVLVYAFGDIDNADITAFLEQGGFMPAYYTHAITAIVTVAVFLTYPLQLYPALQVVEVLCGMVTDDKWNKSKVSEDSLNKYSSMGLLRNHNAEEDMSLTSFGCSTTLHAPCDEETIHTDYILDGDPQDIQTPPGTPSKTETSPNRFEILSSFPDLSKFQFLRTESLESFTIKNKRDKLSAIFPSMKRNSYNKIVSPDDSSHSVTSQDYETIVDESSSTFNTLFALPKSSVRIGLIVLTSLIATFIPDVALLVSLAGASTGSVLSLVIPATMELALATKQGRQLSPFEKLMDCLSICIGIWAACVGTVVSLQAIITKYS